MIALQAAGGLTMGVHTKLQNQIQNSIQTRIQQTKQVIKATVPPKLMERADQVLLGLSHTGQTIPNLLKQTFKKIEGNPHDVIGRLSRTVIEHAESVRATLTKSASAPAEPAAGAGSAAPEAATIVAVAPAAAAPKKKAAPPKKAPGKKNAGKPARRKTTKK